MLIKNCLNCKKEFGTKISLIKIDKGKFCSKECFYFFGVSDETRRKMREAKIKNPPYNKGFIGTGKAKKRRCVNCDLIFFPKNHSIIQKYCSRLCYTKHKIPWNKGTKGLTISWNKGKTGVYSKETKIKMGLKNKNRIMPLSVRQKISQKLTKGNTLLLEAIRKCFLYRIWRLNIFKKNDYTCQFCKKRGGKLNSDHWPKRFIDIIKHNKVFSLEDAMNCKELWDTNNGRTLCKNCHFIRHSKKVYA